jgi:hypothetical protein
MSAIELTETAAAEAKIYIWMDTLERTGDDKAKMGQTYRWKNIFWRGMV